MILRTSLCAQPYGRFADAFAPGECSNPMRILTFPSLHTKKPPRGGFCLYGGEGGIRTLGTVKYTHFPGVLFRPLRHLTKIRGRTLHKALLKRKMYSHHCTVFGNALLTELLPIYPDKPYRKACLSLLMMMNYVTNLEPLGKSM